MAIVAGRELEIMVDASSFFEELRILPLLVVSQTWNFLAFCSLLAI